MDKRPFSRQELINVLRGWHKFFTNMSKSHERNVKALAEAADWLEHDGYMLKTAPRYEDEEDY